MRQNVKTLRKIFQITGNVLLSLLMPGLSQISYGRIKRGIILYLVSQAFFLLAVFTCILPFQPLNIVIPLLIILVVYIAVIADAIIIARNPENVLQMHPVLAGALLVGILIVNTAVLKPVIGRSITARVAEPFQIPSAGMSPSLLPGDYIVASKLPNSLEPKRGDIVIFPSPSDPSRMLVRRVVGLGGELVQVKGEQTAY
jgi:hypothetical protein